MEPETLTDPVVVPPVVPPVTPPITPDPTPMPAPLKTTQRSKIKLLPIFGGIAVILFSIALAIVFFGQDKTAPSSTSAPSTGSEVAQQVAGWPKYTNVDFFYEIAVPPKWSQIKLSPLESDIVMFDGDSTATLQIKAKKEIGSLDDYLTTQDEANKNTIKSKGSSQVKVGQYDGYEREESWPTVGLQAISSYVKIQDMLYTFTLSPSGDQSAVTNETIIRDYHAILASFRLTDTTRLGLDLKDYTSQKIESLAYPAFALKYPQTWVTSEQFVGKDSLILSVYRNNYEIKITQAPVGAAVCLFKDSPDFQGSSGDLRSKDFTEFSTADGTIMRRYFNKNEGDKSTIFFCRKEKDSPYFSTPTDMGGIAYYVPAKYDIDIIKEMDEIVKSITKAP